MKRRDFLGGVAGAALLARTGFSKDAPSDIRITRVVSFELESTRPKFVGKNSFRHDHGKQAFDRIVRLHTNAGIDGFGTCWAGANECAQLLGKNPLDLFDRRERRASGPLGHGTTPIWGLVGKILNQPVYTLLGSAGPPRVPVYDGSIYFIDLRPEFVTGWQDQFKREIDLGLAAGHRAFKVKVGRGRLWMLTEKGYARDVEVIRLIRKHVGPDIVIGADANNAYDLDRTKRFMQDTADCRLAFVEEMFRESVPQYRDLKAFISQHEWKTLIADGENIHRLADMKPWVEAGVVDILQADMNRLGFEGALAEADMARPHGATIAPHNWGSLFGFYMQLHVARGVSNFYMAEQDPLACKAVITDGFKIKDGRCTVPDAPGLGLELDERVLPDVASVHFDLKA